jgi:hypothetical protein
MRTIAGLLTVGWVLLCAGPPAVIAQTDDWSAVRAVRAGQKVQVTGEFQSVTERWLVLTRRGKVVYIDKPDVRQVSFPAVRKDGPPWTSIGVGFGALMGLAAGQGAGPIAIPIDTAVFGALGALADRTSTEQRTVIVYRDPSTR